MTLTTEMSDSERLLLKSGMEKLYGNGDYLSDDELRIVLAYHKQAEDALRYFPKEFKFVKSEITHQTDQMVKWSIARERNQFK